jgi:isopentenyl-diphosphate delta-isomerase
MEMPEVLLVDSHDRIMGVHEKLDAHLRGLRHRAFSVFILNQRGEILLQRRSLSKYHSGGLWANSCCGHPANAQEDTCTAAERRVREELGLACELVRIFRTSYRARVSPSMIENEIVHVFKGFSDQDPTPSPEEVADWAWVPVGELAHVVASQPRNYAAWLKHYVFDCSAALEKLQPVRG